MLCKWTAHFCQGLGMKKEKICFCKLRNYSENLDSIASKKRIFFYPSFDLNSQAIKINLKIPWYILL